MKRSRFFLVILALPALFELAPAQSDKFMPHGGFTYQYFLFRDRGGAVDQAYFYGLSGGFDYVLMQSNDQVSLGIDPNVNFSFSFSSYGTSLLLQTPVFLAAHVGAGSTPYNEGKVGVGAGIGMNLSYFNQSNGLTRSSLLFVGTGAMVELMLRTRASDYAIRVNFTPVRTTTQIDGNDIYLNNIGLSILYTF